MTIQEINALILDDVKSIIQARVWVKMTVIPERPDPLPENFDEQVWYDSQFTQEELDAEFTLYVQELRDFENERLRKEDLKARFSVISNEAFRSAYPDTVNSSMFLKELLEDNDHVVVETIMQQLETKHFEISNSPDAIKNNWADALRKDLAQNKITIEGLIEAVVKKVILNDHSQADALKEKLQEINVRNPRP